MPSAGDLPAATATRPVSPRSCSARRRLHGLAFLLALLLVLTLAWNVSPAQHWLAPDALLGRAQRMSWAGQMAVFVLAGCAAVPLSLLVLLLVLVQGPLLGLASSLLGGALIGSLSFAAGAALGRQAVAEWAGPRVQVLTALVARRGLLAVMLARLVPIAPFAVVNLILGATPIRWPAFLIGNTLGMLPMVLANAWLAPQILRQLRQPSTTGWAVVVGSVLLLGAGTWALKRWATRQAQFWQAPPPSSEKERHLT